MKKIIIGIHGLGNKPSQPLLEQWWRQSITDGIIAAGHPPPDFQFELVYWSDLLHPLPLNPDQTDIDHEQYLSEPYTTPVSDELPDPKPIRRKILDYLEKQMDKLLLNDDYSINFTAVTDSIIRHYFHDLDCYYSSECMTVGENQLPARLAIRKRLNEALHNHGKKEILLLSHSMGSIVAYDVMTRSASDVVVDTWITAGSPLGLPIVISKIVSEQKKRLETIREVQTPDNVTSAWLNFSDLEDRVAIDYALAGDYKENTKGIQVQDAVVSNRYAFNGKSNSHKSFGYFQTPEVGDSIYQFLTRKKPIFWKHWITQMRESFPSLPFPPFKKRRILDES